MKNRIATALFIVFFIISASVSAQNKKAENNKTVTFEVSMTCENCVRTIEKNIAYEKGMKDMKIDLTKKLVTLRFDTSKTSEEKIIEAFDKLGYVAVVKKGNQTERNVNK